MWLAPGSLPAEIVAIMLVTTCAVVASANSLNCWLERDVDQLMARTARRPLPSGRLRPNIAFWFGVVLGVTSIPLLTFFVNPMTGLLGAIALISYVAIYTPMKQRSPAALLVGSVPGALPPLMGWTAATGTIDAPGVALFAILFIWQLPHFIAISIYRREEYERAGMKVLPSVRGEQHAKVFILLYTGALIVSSVLPFVFRVAGPIYLTVACAVGVYYFAVNVRGLRKEVTGEVAKVWARKSFLASLVYLTALFAALMIDAIVL